MEQQGQFAEKKFHIHLVSDATGETLNAIVNAALAQFEGVDVQVHPYALVRSDHQLTRALDHVAIMPGLVFFTMANQAPRDKLILRCMDIGARAIDVLDAITRTASIPLAYSVRDYGVIITRE